MRRASTYRPGGCDRHGSRGPPSPLDDGSRSTTASTPAARQRQTQRHGNTCVSQQQTEVIMIGFDQEWLGWPEEKCSSRLARLSTKPAWTPLPSYNQNLWIGHLTMDAAYLPL